MKWEIRTLLDTCSQLALLTVCDKTILKGRVISIKVPRGRILKIMQDKPCIQTNFSAVNACMRTYLRLTEKIENRCKQIHWMFSFSQRVDHCSSQQLCGYRRQNQWRNSKQDDRIHKYERYKQVKIWFCTSKLSKMDFDRKLCIF